MRYLVKDPDISNRVWSMELDREVTIGGLIRSFLEASNREKGVSSICRLRFFVGQLELSQKLLDTRVLTLLLPSASTESLTISSEWNVDFIVPCSVSCGNCDRLRHYKYRGGLNPPHGSSPRTPQPPHPAATDRLTPATNASTPQTADGRFSSNAVYDRLTPRRSTAAAADDNDPTNWSAATGTSLRGDIATQLEKVVNLFQSGYLSEVEFVQAKARLLSSLC